MITSNIASLTRIILKVTCLLLLLEQALYGKTQVYDSKDGLSENRITAIAKDSYGLMWIGTYNGLNIFDGYTFSKMEGDLNSSEITELAYDKQHPALWVGTTQGLFMINTHSFKCTRVNVPLMHGQPEEHFVTGMLPVTGNKSTLLYIVFKNGLVAAVKKSREVQFIARIPSASFHKSYLATCPDGSLFIFAGAPYKVPADTSGNNPVKRLNNCGPGNSHPVISSVSQYDKRTVLVNTYGSGMFLYDLITGTAQIPDFLDQSTFKKDIYYAKKIGDHLYMAASGYSFYEISALTGTIDSISNNNTEIFEGKQYSCFFLDEQGILWIGTNKGIIKFDGKQYLFDTLLYNQKDPVSTRNIIEDRNGDLYVATYNGLYQFLKKEQKWKVYPGNPHSISGQKGLWKGSLIPYSLYSSTDGNYIYIGMESDKLLRFRKKDGFFEEGFYNQDKHTAFHNVYALTGDPDGSIWLGCGNGLATYHPATGKLTVHRNDPYDIGAECMVHSMLISRNQKKLVAATTNGLFIIDRIKGIEAHFTTKSNPALSNEDILFVYEDNKGNLWMATNGGGVNILAGDKKSITILRKENGLSNDIVYGMLQGDTYNFWISTFDGLSRFNTATQTFMNYYTEQGLTADEFNKNSCLRASDGKLYFGSINGVNAFYPRQIPDSSPSEFRVFLSAVSKWDNKTKSVITLRNGHTEDTDIIKRPSDMLIELHFACSDYTDPARNKYLYRIQGLNNSWLSLDNRHSFNVSGIPYGKYTLEVKAMNARSVLSENVLKIRLEITLPVYKKWWFYMLLFLAAAILIYGVYLFKIKRLKTLINLKIRIASNLHDEVGSLLTRITMFSDNLRYGHNSKEQQQTKLEKIARLSREATASMSYVLWTIDARNDFAGNLTDRMREHAEEMLLPLNIELTFDISGVNSRQHIPSELRRDIYLIFKEAINNIAKHARQATCAKVIFMLQGNELLLRISNNGVREQPVKTATGQGLENMKMRAKKIGAAIEMLFENHTFTIRLTK